MLSMYELLLSISEALHFQGGSALFCIILFKSGIALWIQYLTHYLQLQAVDFILQFLQICK